MLTDSPEIRLKFTDPPEVHSPWDYALAASVRVFLKEFS